MILDVDFDKFAGALAAQAEALRDELPRASAETRLQVAAERLGLRRRTVGWQGAGDLPAQARALVRQHAQLDAEALAKRLTAVCLDEFVPAACRRDGAP